MFGHLSSNFPKEVREKSTFETGIIQPIRPIGCVSEVISALRLIKPRLTCPDNLILMRIKICILTDRPIGPVVLTGDATLGMETWS